MPFINSLVVSPWVLWSFGVITAVLLALLLVYSRQLRQALNIQRQKLKESEDARKSALDLISQQHGVINNVGKQIQACLAQELSKQNSYLNQTFIAKDRRLSSRDNWNQIVSLTERLFHFSLRESSRPSAQQLVYSSDVVQKNRKLLEAMCVSYKQTLRLIESRHGLLPLPQGFLDKIIRGALHALLKVGCEGAEIQLFVDCSKLGVQFRFEAYGDGLSQNDVTRIEVAAKVAPNLHYSKRSQDDEEGLNLASVKRLIDDVDGSIQIITARNYTTRLFISLPIIGCELNHSAVLKEVKNANHQAFLNLSSSFTRYSVLIVDMEDLAQIQIHRTLQSKFDCFACKKPLDTLQMIHNLSPDIVYLEQSINDIGCVELIRLIRNNHKTRLLPIVVSCGISSQSFKLAALRAGANHIIDKPVAMAELELVLTRLAQNGEEIAEQVGEELSKYHSDKVLIPEPVEEEKEADFMARFNEMIAENYANENFTREHAGNHLNVTLRTLNRRLKNTYSHNFNEYLKKYRLEKGKELLLKGDPVSEVAFQVGFSAPSYFSTCFRAEYGITPSQMMANCA